MQLFSFWSGRIGWLERLCLERQLELGHAVTLYSYETASLVGLPGAIEVRDARALMPTTPEIERIVRVSPQIVADWLRYRGLAAGAGTWIDTDMLLLRPVPPAPSLFSFESERQDVINNAILHLPRGDAILADLLAFSDRRPVMAPWWRGKRRLVHGLRARIGFPIPPEGCQWGVFGPKALTHFVRANGRWSEATGWRTYHPVPLAGVADLVTPGVDARMHMDATTIGAHLWGSRVRRLIGDAEPPAGSALGDILRDGVDAWLRAAAWSGGR